MRGECVITVYDRPVKTGSNPDSISSQLSSFLTEISHHCPSLVLLYIPREVDTKRKLDICTIFAPTVAVIKVQFRLLGFPWEMEAGEARMEAVLVGRLGLTLDLVLVLAREREDGQWRQVLLHSGDRDRELDVEDEEADKVLADQTNLTMVIEPCLNR